MTNNSRKILTLERLCGFLIGCWLIVFCPHGVLALNPHKAVTQYVHHVWTSNDGLPQDAVNAIVQTPDGYLWCATQEGLARFDGVKFTVFDASNVEGMGSFVFTLFADRAGTLWIGTGGGMLSYRAGKFTRFAVADGLPDISVKHISEDAAGSLWLSAGSGDKISGGKGLAQFTNGRAAILTVEDGLTSNQIYKTLTDRRGDLWIATTTGLNRRQNGTFHHFTTADGLAGNLVRTVFEDRAGNIWIGTKTGLSRYKDDKFTAYTIADGLSDNSIFSLYEDKDGVLWIGTEKGLSRIVNNQIEAVKGIAGLADDRIFSFLEDREGSLWIGTHANGLHCLRDAKFTTYGTEEGLRGSSVNAVYEDRAGNIWIGTAPGGLNVLSQGKFKTYAAADGLPHNNVGAIFETRAGDLLIGSEEVLSRFSASGFADYGARRDLNGARPRAMYEGGDGALFVATTKGLSLFKDGKVRNFDENSGIIGGGVNFIHRENSGALLIGGDEGLSRFENGNLTPLRRGMPIEFNPQSVTEDADGTLWITSWGQGLHQLKNGRLTVFTVKEGLFDNTAWSVLDDGAGNLWMGCNRGVFRVAKDELNNFADGKITRISSIVYGAADGMRKRETNAGNPSALRASDGRLWFATVAGAVVIDPQNIEINRVPPPVVIEKLLSDDCEIGLSDERLELAAGTRNVEFQYVGLSFVSPEKVKYKYKLIGFDRDWVDADARHTAYYTNLSPGDYEFRVIAANNDRVWNETGAGVKIRVLTPFWRTDWFFGLAFLSLGGVVLMLFNWRVARLRLANRRQTIFAHQLIESQETERKRIAAELHDNLGQHLVIIKNWATLGLKLTARDAPAREQLEVISTTALQAINEVREIVYDLRPTQLETVGLCRTIKFMVEQASSSSGIAFECRCDELDDCFAPEAEVIFYRVVQECVSNILKHSNAENASVIIKRDWQLINLEITDDGGGFVREANNGQNSRKSFGLIGLNERVEMLGGKIEMQSIVGKGTTVSINIQI